MSEKTYTDEMGAEFSKDRKTLGQAPWDVEEYVVPEGTERIGSFAFRMTTLQTKSPQRKVVLPETLKSISSDAFYICTSLQEVNLPNSLEEIGDEAFFMCESLKEIVLPQNLKTIKSNPFPFCDVVVSSLSPNFTVEDGCIYGDNGKRLIRIATNEQRFSVKEGVEVIACNALDKDLEELVLPKSLKSVEGSDYDIKAKRVVLKGVPTEPLMRAVSHMFKEDVMNVCGIDLINAKKSLLSKDEKLLLNKAKAGKRQPLFDAIRIVVDGFIDNRDIDPMKALTYYSAGNHLYYEFMSSDHPLTKKLDKFAYFCDVMEHFNSRYVKREEDEDFTPKYDTGYKKVCMQEIATNPNQKQVEALCYGIVLLLRINKNDVFSSWEI